MIHGPCCPIHQSTLDSPDYWTDPALMSSAAPAPSTEWRRWENESRTRHARWATRHGQWQTTPGQDLCTGFAFMIVMTIILRWSDSTTADFFPIEWADAPLLNFFVSYKLLMHGLNVLFMECSLGLAFSRFVSCFSSVSPRLSVDFFQLWDSLEGWLPGRSWF